jgi:hypothetical protein
MPGTVHLDTNLSRSFTLPVAKDHPRTFTFNARSANLLNHTSVTAVNTILSSGAVGRPVAAENRSPYRVGRTIRRLIPLKGNRGISLVFRETRISCTQLWKRRRVRLSFKERRMKFREATLLLGKSGMWDTAALPLKPAAGPTALHGCPTFAQAYVGRKRWATRISCFTALARTTYAVSL